MVTLVLGGIPDGLSRIELACYLLAEATPLFVLAIGIGIWLKSGKRAA